MSTANQSRGGRPSADERTLVLLGPTASGKSGLSIDLAERLMAEGRPAEIVNADSMLVYRGMDIGTAKPTAAERARVVHHLVDVLDVTETATVAEFQRRARAAIANCHARQVLPIVVGGSALYIRAIVDDFDFPGTDAAVRDRWERELASIGPEALHARLAAMDPAAAAAILPGNGRRIVRALEVIELTGRPYAAQLPQRRYLLPGVVQIGLAIDRPALDRRIEQRVDAMWAAGLVTEVSELVRHGLRDGVTASRALGYRQVLEFLDGQVDEDEARRRTVVGTRKFARRQDSWFRQDPRIGWLAYDRPDLVDAAAALAGVED
ncbi:MAG TPA: tRNA (adenosine(37)-N6)-dimethylallyltransferase MiaA [Microlunatus sp.]|nr:tRNA (adenosine(37)-N6)-dimethylallyltransferase MiaA [Microlunatus sp.]